MPGCSPTRRVAKFGTTEIQDCQIADMLDILDVLHDFESVIWLKDQAISRRIRSGSGNVAFVPSSQALFL
jgi:hypothetical protein